MYLLPPLPILQMPGRGNAHHLGTRTSPLMTSIRSPVYPPNTTIPRPPPQKAASPVRKALILRTFCPSGTKIGRHFGGYLSAHFSGLSLKKRYFSPSLSHTPQPYFVRPPTRLLSVHFVLPVVLPHRNSRTKAKIFTLASPPTLLHNKPPILSAQISPIFALKTRI